MAHFADRLLDAIDATHSYLAVGLDPQLASLPPELLGEPASLEQAADVAERFCRAIVDGVAGIVCAVKPQSAFFEQFGFAGLAALERLIAHCHEAGLLVIEDAKRGDIGTTMAAYSTALLGRQSLVGAELPVHDADAVTLSPFLGPDSLVPMIETAIRFHKGLFVLVRTSNPGSAHLQLLRIADGQRLFEHVAAMVDRLGADYVGDRGFSIIGAVCGLTFPGDAASLRALMPRSLFLVPGLGPQGGRIADFSHFLNEDGHGAIIASARTIASGWHSQPEHPNPAERVRRGARAAAEQANEDLRHGLLAADRWRW